MINGKKIVALCIPRINESCCHSFITALNRNLPSDDYRLLVFATGTFLYWNTPSEKGESAIFDLINYDNVDIIVIFEEKIKNKDILDAIIRKAAHHDIPVITVDGTRPGAISVVFDFEEGFRSVIRHLIDVHHVKRFHMLAGIKGNDFSQHREDVFKQELESHGIPVDGSMISYGDFWTKPAKEAAERLIDENRLPEALVCANDTMAIAAATALVSHGIGVPEDVIVTGFDGIDEIRYSTPNITSCMCSYEKMARKVCELAVECIDGGLREGHYKINPSLILSESCGCCKEPPVYAMQQMSILNNRLYRMQSEEYDMYCMTARIFECSDIKEVSEVINGSRFYDIDIVLKKECIDETVNPLHKSESGNAYGRRMVRIYSSDEENRTEIKEFFREDALPGLSKLLNFRIPIIFHGLNFLDVPLGYICAHFHDDDIENYYKVPQTINALNNAIGSFRNMRYQHYIQRMIEDAYKTDALTGLYNRSGFFREYDRTLRDALKKGELSVVMCDLDGLKRINDTYGHDEGDNAIKTAAKALKDCCPEGAICVRFGGDEMVAAYAGHLDGEKLKQEINAYLQDYNSVSGKPYEVSASIGVFVGHGAWDFDEMVRHSDKLMYADKIRKKAAREN